MERLEERKPVTSVSMEITVDKPDADPVTYRLEHKLSMRTYHDAGHFGNHRFLPETWRSPDGSVEHGPFERRFGEYGNAYFHSGHGYSVEFFSIKTHDYLLDLMTEDSFDTSHQFSYAWEHHGTVKTGSRAFAGDTDRDGDVDFGDFLNLSANFGKAVDATWAEGDFSLDGVVGFDDFLMLSAAFGDGLNE